MMRQMATTALFSLAILCGRQAAAAQDYEGSASSYPSSSGGYAGRPLTMPEGRLRLDIAPPDYGYMDHGELNNGRGLRVWIPDEGDAGVNLGLGGAYGIMDELEAGALLFPFRFAPDFDFGDMELYACYAFLRDSVQLGVQAVLRIPTASDFGLGFGVPARIALGSSARLDSGLELEMIFADDARVNLDLPLAINANIGGSGFLGGRTGLVFWDFEEMAINLGAQGGATIDDMVVLTASLNFPMFLWTGPGDAVNPDIEIIAGANIYLDVR